MSFATLAVTALFALPATAAETNFNDAKRLVVDVVWLKGGGELRGAILDARKG